MADYQQRREIREARDRLSRLLLSPLAIIVTFAVCLLIARSTWEVYKKERHASDRAADEERSRDELLAQKQRLLSDIARLGSRRGVEEELRTKYDVAKPGERVIIVVENEAVATTTATSTPSFGERFWSMVRGFFVR